MAKFCLTKQVTIATGLKLDWYDATNGDVAVSITAGTYADIYAAASQVETDINTALGAGTATLDILSATSIGHAQFGFTEAFQIKWATGANAGSTPGALFGFSEAADDSSSGDVITSDYQVQDAWFSAWAPGSASKGTREQPEHIGGEEFVVVNGSHSVELHAATRHRRFIECIMQPAHKVYEEAATGSYTNQAFETFQQSVLEDDERYIRYRPDYTAPGTYTTCAISGLKNWAKDIKRLNKGGLERYSWTLEMLTQET